MFYKVMLMLFYFGDTIVGETVLDNLNKQRGFILSLSSKMIPLLELNHGHFKTIFFISVLR